MSETMVEKVARAIQEGLLAAGIHSDQYVPQDIARDAIEAMRYPTAAMVAAVENDAVIQNGLDDCNKHDIPEKSWDLMISAALHDPEGGEA